LLADAAKSRPGQKRGPTEREEAKARKDGARAEPPGADREKHLTRITPRGLKRFIVLFLIDLSTRKVEIAGIASSANGLWMSQIGRRVTDVIDGILNGRRYLIHDRDPLFTLDFRTMLASVGVQSVKLPPRSPNLNAHAERFVRSIKESCLNRIIFFGETSLRRAVHEFVAHYHHERNHQGLGNRLILPEPSRLEIGAIRRRQRLGGTLNYYYRSAA